MPYRVEDITIQERVKLSCQMVAHQGEYGLVTRLAGEYGVSRQYLYELRDRTLAAAQLELSPRSAGRKRVDQRLQVDELLVARAILVLNQVAHASIRDIRECLEEILGVHRSVGSIHRVLQTAAARAYALPQPVPNHPILAVADEVYAADKPVLEVVEHTSGLILALQVAHRADETAWGCTLLELDEQGVEMGRILTDGGKGLRAGIGAAGISERNPDHWHELRALGRVRSWLEGEAYRKLKWGEKIREEARVQEQQLLHGGRRCRMGRPFKVEITDPQSVTKAIATADEAVVRYDAVEYLLRVVRDVLAPVDARTGRVREAEWVSGELLAAAQLLRALGGRAVRAAKLLEEHAPDLVKYLMPLQQALTLLQHELGEANIRYLAWAWRHRSVLDLEDAAQAWSGSPQQARQVWAELERAVRASGMVENLGSLLAPHRASHKALPEPLLQLFQVYRNHHVFERGRRAGYSPLQLAGLPSPHWLDALGYSRTPDTHISQPLPNHTQTVNTIAA